MQLSADHVAKLRARVQQEIDAGVLRSCQYALAWDGHVLISETLGEAPPDARYSIWSATKPVFASLVWQLIGEGLLDPEAPVAELWPEFAAHGKDAVTLEHLLLFTAGFPDRRLDLATIGDREARIRQMEQWELDWEPGTAYGYHGLSAHEVMAELVERVAGQDRRQLLRERVLQPLGLDAVELGVPVERQDTVRRLSEGGEAASLEEIASALGLTTVPPELKARFDQAMAAGSGVGTNAELFAFQQSHVLAYGLPGGGAVSDAASLALFYQALLDDRQGLWDPDVLRDVTQNVRNTYSAEVDGGPANRTRGLVVRGLQPAPASPFGTASAGTFGHDGAAGQVAWADPETGLSFAFLTDTADRNVVRMARRGSQVASAAAACCT